MDKEKICKNCGDKERWHPTKPTKRNPSICHGADCKCEVFK